VTRREAGFARARDETAFRAGLVSHTDNPSAPQAPARRKSRQRIVIPGKNIGIFCKLKPATGRDALADLVAWLRARDYRVFLDDETAAVIGEASPYKKPEIPAFANLIVVLGGDGTLLSVARVAHPYNVPILAVNLGSLGFMTEVALPDLYKTFEKVMAGDCVIEKRMLLNAVLRRNGKIEREHNVLNDVVINKGALARIVNLQVRVNDQYMTSYSADGLIVATPTGSTAYSLSAGGPIIHPSMDALVLSPICPFALTNRPIVIPDQSRIQIALAVPNEDVRITLDGQEGCDLRMGDVLIVKKAENYIHLAQAPGKNFYQILRTKLHWGGKAETAKWKWESE
jgi:NAD+ kinase